MKINNIWDNNKVTNQIDIISHPLNEHIVENMHECLKKSKKISVIEIKSSRNVLIQLSDIEVITSLGHLSQISTSEGKKYYFNKKLKELTYLEKHLFYRINQSTILNVDDIISFNVSANSRLEVVTKKQNTYLVSRHYAKNIKERLS
ncbi:LytTR family DNA-binding domain-containing protein [Brochothrix thermosphacta]|uniref:HTH LytTR-type domain-containing protein n=1 Tax=Brochothrix thermosphacta TaxID=2756 RepID=A0A2X0QIU8_BROTH|nr:LytTR family DNA-binding domain-containing protein [Brochothrix thermosphacta]ODJ51518.1 hypothetical protein BFR34_00725 [Brochothrix thermosphacta DSM 20171 = FSL F6-1036]ODJ57862.1 hypothetical protein BFR44_10400 [Brochothrix thermosphacta]ODJ63722.1 hypothetical protein BFR35_08185 [Brochothrix thermosphacta]ODJ66766.1 hypothetical protein BFR37_08010 [Brochothrix thermosphacta]SPP28524.1 conserved hypothetical protein [Brochothrix thermosphacta]